MLPTLFREYVWREKCCLPQSFRHVPRSHSTTSMGLQPQGGTQWGNGFLPFLSLYSFPLLRSEWQSFLGILCLSLSGASFQDPYCLEVQTGSYGRKREMREGRNSPPDPSYLDLPRPVPIMPATVCFLDSSGSCSVHAIHILISSSGREGIECVFSVLPGTGTVL